jgi:nitroreductase/NAD-dependent dihydropyrimidine dehydrogenase PreA subunit
MNMINIDKDSCKGCGLCINDCPNGVFVQDGKGRPKISKPENCINCGHCTAVCPSDSIYHTQQSAEKTVPVDHKEITVEMMESFLSSKRSVRNYSKRPVDKEVVRRLLKAANMAPSSKNCQERGYIVVYDSAKIEAIKLALIKNAKRILFWLNLAVSRFSSWFIHPEVTKALKKIILGFEISLEKADKGEDSIFHNALCVIFIYGIEKDIFGKDNALAAQHYLISQAEAMGLGTCIIGYAQAAPKILAKYLDVPKFYKIYGVVTLGYPGIKFKRTVERNPAEIKWYGQPENGPVVKEKGERDPEQTERIRIPIAA